MPEEFDYTPEQAQAILKALEPLKPGIVPETVLNDVRIAANSGIITKRMTRTPYAGRVRKELRSLSDSLDKVEKAFDGLSDEASGYISNELPDPVWPVEFVTGVRARWAFKTYLLPMRDAAREAVNSPMNELPRMGRPEDQGTQHLVWYCAKLYERFTGKFPRRAKEGHPNQFYKFVYAVVGPTGLTKTPDGIIKDPDGIIRSVLKQLDESRARNPD